MKTLLKILWFVAKGLMWAMVVVAPTLGVWVASSLAAYLNGPIWLACLAGLFLFPLLPLGWDLWATKRFAARQERRTAAGKKPRERIVTFWDRLIIRTFVVNVGFLAALLSTFPQAGFTALATRGDWFLERTDAEAAEVVRPALFKGAEGLAWLYEWSKDNPYEQFGGDESLPTPTANEFGQAEQKPNVDKPGPSKPDTPTPKPDVVKPDVVKPDVVKPDVVKPDVVKPDTPKIVIEEVGTPPDESRAFGVAPAWPMKPKLHPVVAKMPESVKTDYGSVARYIKEREPDAFQRVKALHDFVADRTVYDVAALRSGEFPSQKAKDVFDSKLAVCAGYSRLLEAMGKVTGDEIVYVGGDSRDENGGVAGGGHAWNAAKIEGKWYLIDATWDAGFVNGNGPFKKLYRTNYLFTPPAVFGADHFPDDSAWQLRTDPITRGEFVRQPMMESEFHVQGLELVSPTRSQVEARNGELTITLNNPLGKKVLGTVAAGGKKRRCKATGRKQVRVRCEVPRGTHKLKLFAGNQNLTTFPFVGQFEVTSR